MNKEKKAQKLLLKKEMNETKNELKNLDEEYSLKIKTKRKEVIDFNKEHKNLKKSPKEVEGQIYKIPRILKFALLFAKCVAIIQSIFFIPFAWSIWFFNRYSNFYKGISIENKTKIGINALIFYGIIPGIIILSVSVKGK